MDNQNSETSMVGRHVVVRTYSAGVHIGTVAHHAGREVRLTAARRLWQWRGAFTLNAVASHGIDAKESKLTVPVDEIVLTEAIEIIPTTEAARATFDACPARHDRA